MTQLFFEGCGIEIKDRLDGFSGVQFELQPRHDVLIRIEEVGVMTINAQLLTLCVVADGEVLQHRQIELTEADSGNFVWKKLQEPLVLSYQVAKKPRVGFFSLTGYMAVFNWNGGQPCGACNEDRIDFGYWQARRPYIAWAYPVPGDGCPLNFKFSFHDDQNCKETP